MRRFVCTLHLPFLDHVHDFDAAQNDTRAVEVFEPQHRSSSTFDGPMVLLDDVVQILGLTDLDGCLALRIHRMQCRPGARHCSVHNCELEVTPAGVLRSTSNFRGLMHAVSVHRKKSDRWRLTPR